MAAYSINPSGSADPLALPEVSIESPLACAAFAGDGDDALLQRGLVFRIIPVVPHAKQPVVRLEEPQDGGRRYCE